MKNPLEMLKAEGRTQVEVGICDGSVDVLPLKSPESWRKLVQPADGGIVNYEEFSK